MKSTTRQYRMTARAEAAAANHQRILDVTQELARERWLEDITLDDVAARAHVSVQTVLRRFGSREALFDAASGTSFSRVREERDAAPVGDVDAAVRNLVDHYERDGAMALLMLAQEERSELMRAGVESGRAYHRDWVERTFAPLIEQRPSAAPQLVAICDVYFWKVLRQDLGLSRDQAEQSIRDLIGSLENGA